MSVPDRSRDAGHVGLPYSGNQHRHERFPPRWGPDGESDIRCRKVTCRLPRLNRRVRSELPPRFRRCNLFFQPADIVDQVLNSVARRRLISGCRLGHRERYAIASRLAAEPVAHFRGGSIPTCSGHDAPALHCCCDRALATRWA